MSLFYTVSPILIFGILITILAWRIPGSIIGPILAGIIGLIITAIGGFLWRIHQRTKKNAQRLDRLSRTIYGDEDDDTRPGITVEIQELHQEVRSNRETLENIGDSVDRLHEKID